MRVDDTDPSRLQRILVHVYPSAQIFQRQTKHPRISDDQQQYLESGEMCPRRIIQSLATLQFRTSGAVSQSIQDLAKIWGHVFSEPGNL